MSRIRLYCLGFGRLLLLVFGFERGRGLDTHASWLSWELWHGLCSRL